MRYDESLNRILSRAPGCPDEVAIEALRDACIEWCRSTYMLTTGMRVVSGSDLVPDGPVGELTVIDVIEARAGELRLPVVPINDQRVDDATAEAPVISFAELSALTINPTPAAPLTVDLVAVVCPGADSVTFPALLWAKHREALVGGALARVLSDEGVPWSKPQQAAVQRAIFDREASIHSGLYGRNRLTAARRLRVQPA